MINCGSQDTITFAAFQNPHNSNVVVAINQTEIEQSAVLEYQNRQVVITIPEKTIGTFIWSIL